MAPLLVCDLGAKHAVKLSPSVPVTDPHHLLDAPSVMCARPVQQAHSHTPRSAWGHRPRVATVLLARTAPRVALSRPLSAAPPILPLKAPVPMAAASHAPQRATAALLVLLS